MNLHYKTFSAADAAQCAVEGSSIPERMAALMIDQNRDCTDVSLARAGFSEAEIRKHGAEARDIARKQFCRDDTPPAGTSKPSDRLNPLPDTPAETESLIGRAAFACAGLLPLPSEMIFALRRAGFSMAFIARHWDMIVARAADDFAASRGAADPIAEGKVL